MKLWIDDIREMPEDFDVWAKTANEALNILKSGKVTHVSFDHDLGDVMDGDATGYDVAKWVEEQAYHGKIDPFTYAVHSANTVGASKIRVAMWNAERFWNKHAEENKN